MHSIIEQENQIIESTVTEKYSQLRIDKYLSERFPYQSRTQWQKEIKAKKISINGEIIKSINIKIKNGDKISYETRNLEEPEIDPNFTILYEDEYILAINKSGNLPVHPSGRFFNHTLSMLLKKQYGINYIPIHRLDRETTGVILFSKTSEAASEFHKHFENFNKHYTAITHGLIKEKKFTVNMPIGPDLDSPVRKKRAAYEAAEESAKTHFKLLDTFWDESGKDAYSVVQARLTTGRLHQIRVHLQYAGFPILGDKIYGLDDTFYLEFIDTGMTTSLIEKIKFPRCALHSMRIEFHHPFKEKNMTIEAPLPEDMASFIS